MQLHASWICIDLSKFSGIVGMSRLSCNPFAIKSSTQMRGVADSTDSKGKIYVNALDLI